MIQQLWCSDLGINSALLFIATVFSLVRIIDLVQVGSEHVFHDVTGHETCVMLTFNRHYCTQTYSAVLKLAFWCFCMLQLCKQIRYVWIFSSGMKHLPIQAVGYHHSRFGLQFLRDMGVYFANKKLTKPFFPTILLSLHLGYIKGIFSIWCEKRNWFTTKLLQSEWLPIRTSTEEEPVCTPPHLSEVSPALPLKRFQCLSDWQWPSLIYSRKII